ncbi:MAG: DUF4112 domain-containing protein [Gammaproteobacteria bacterium]|nr:DUF4112 domain-containing protein [Gammaproteobacteria bacterium]
MVIRTHSKDSIGNVDSAEPEASAAVPSRWRTYAHWLDSLIELPGGYRIGLGSILGLFPGVGDAAGAVLGVPIVLSAWRNGASKAVLFRMVGNLALDTIVGAVPVLGDLFDFAFKSHQRNVDLLERYAAEPVKTRRRSMVSVVALCAGFILVLVLVIAAALTVAGYLLSLLTTG